MTCTRVCVLHVGGSGQPNLEELQDIVIICRFKISGKIRAMAEAERHEDGTEPGFAAGSPRMLVPGFAAGGR